MQRWAKSAGFRDWVWSLAIGLAVGWASFAAEVATAADNPIEITTSLPNTPLTVSAVNSKDFAVVCTLKNTTDKAVVVWPYLGVELVDDKDQPVKRTRNLGRFGRRSTDSALESVPFATIPAGKTHEIKVNLKQYMYDPVVITAWRISEPGTYRLKLHYQFDRDQVKKTLGQGCKTLDDAGQPWNQALELNEKLEAKLPVN